jgi:hypothetical protein
MKHSNPLVLTHITPEGKSREVLVLGEVAILDKMLRLDRGFTPTSTPEPINENEVLQIRWFVTETYGRLLSGDSFAMDQMLDSMTNDDQSKFEEIDDDAWDQMCESLVRAFRQASFALETLYERGTPDGKFTVHWSDSPRCSTFFGQQVTRNVRPRVQIVGGR